MISHSCFIILDGCYMDGYSLGPSIRHSVNRVMFCWKCRMAESPKGGYVYPCILIWIGMIYVQRNFSSSYPYMIYERRSVLWEESKISFGSHEIHSGRSGIKATSRHQQETSSNTLPSAPFCSHRRFWASDLNRTMSYRTEGGYTFLSVHL